MHKGNTVTIDSYSWQDGSSAQALTIEEIHRGNTLSCTVTATSSNGVTKVFNVTDNVIEPINNQCNLQSSGPNLFASGTGNSHSPFLFAPRLSWRRLLAQVMKLRVFIWVLTLTLAAQTGRL